MGTIVKLKGKTEAQLIAENPLLEDRQLCFATDTKNFKVGPGSWNSLQYWIGNNSIDLSRPWSDSLLFDKREIATTTKTQTADIIYTIASSGHSTTEFCYRQDIIICDGIHSINFDFSGLPGILTFINGITSGEIPPAGTFVILFSYRIGVLMVSWPGATSESSSSSQLATPGSFLATASGQTIINLAWTDVAGETNYLIEQSDTGAGGWTILNSPAAGSTSYSHTGLTANTTKYYRISAIGNGTTILNSPYATSNATTSSAGDVTAPVATFSPSNGAVDWSVNKAITISFNEAIRKTDGTQITDANVAALLTLKQTNSSGANIAFTAIINAGKTLITITPSAATLGGSQLVYLAVAPIEDTTGNESAIQSITFTTTDYSEFNGSSNHLRAGDILDSLFAVNDTYFEVEFTIKDHSLAGTHWLCGKFDSAGNQRTFYTYSAGTDMGFLFAMGTTVSRQIKWTNVLTAGEHKIVFKYNGAIDTNDGLDRVTLEIDDVVQGSKTLQATSGTLTGTLFNSTAQLSFGDFVNAAGTATGTNKFTGKAKGLKIRSNSATLMNIAVLAIGTDSSGNSNNGTWV